MFTAKEEPDDQMEDLNLFSEFDDKDFGKDLLGVNDLMTLLEEPGVQECDKKNEHNKLTNGVYPSSGHQSERLAVTNNNNTPSQPNHLQSQSLTQQPTSHMSNTPSPQLQHNGLSSQQVSAL